MDTTLNSIAENIKNAWLGIDSPEKLHLYPNFIVLR